MTILESMERNLFTPLSPIWLSLPQYSEVLPSLNNICECLSYIITSKPDEHFWNYKEIFHYFPEKNVLIHFLSWTKCGFHCIDFRESHNAQRHFVKIFYIKCASDCVRNIENTNKNSVALSRKAWLSMSRVSQHKVCCTFFFCKGLLRRKLWKSNKPFDHRNWITKKRRNRWMNGSLLRIRLFFIS